MNETIQSALRQARNIALAGGCFGAVVFFAAIGILTLFGLMDGGK